MSYQTLSDNCAQGLSSGIIGAGALNDAARQQAIAEQMAYNKQRLRERLRETALQLATGAGEPYDITIKRAEAYLSFLEADKE